MDIYILHANNLKKAASGIERFDVHDKQLLLFSEPDEPPDPELFEKIEKAFAKTKHYQCPLEETKLIFNQIKNGRKKEDILFFIGPDFSSFAERAKNDLLGIVSGVCISKTLNTTNKYIYRKKKNKTRNQEVDGQLSFSGEQTDLLYTGLIQGMTNAEASEKEKESSPVPTKNPKPPVSAKNTKPPVPHSPKRENKPPAQTHKPLKKEEKKQKQVLDSIYKETEYKIPYSDVENAKASLCECLLERIYQHITDLFFSGNQDSNPIRQEDTVYFITILLRSYSIALEKIKKENGEILANQIDYEALMKETMDLFEKSWAVSYSIVKLKKESLTLILQESQFYWRLTKMLYEEDVWENI